MSRERERIEGERRKDEILQTLAARRESIINRARRRLLGRLLDVGVATADDVYRGLELPDGVDARCLGSVPGHLARAGLIRRDGYVSSDRKERHASVISKWQLINAAGAVAWLKSHPEQPEDLGHADVGESVSDPNGTGPAVAQPDLFEDHRP